VDNAAVASPALSSVIIPAYNEGRVIADVVSALLSVGSWHEVIVVDDGSGDDTAIHAAAAGAIVISHPYNKGNGAAVKSGIRKATGDFIIIVDGDGQHRPTDALRLIHRLRDHDLVVGARTGATQATMVRRFGNHILNALASYLTGRQIPDLTSGFRAARADCLRQFVHLLPNGFSTPTTTTLAFLRAGYSVGFEPVEANQRVGESKSKIRLRRDGVSFLLILIKIITVFSPLRIFLPISGVAFALGVGYAVWTIVAYMRITNSSVLLILFAVLVFLMGLVSEQISALRFER
jgi:glycosyltransferase involved in cell wall biosynthesis